LQWAGNGHRNYRPILLSDLRNWTDGTVLQCKNADRHFRLPYVDWQDFRVARIIATMMNR
jgi:hypothetical protein